MELDEFRASLRDADACHNCGACLSFCKWDAFEREKPGERGTPAICRDCMVCFRICPRPQGRYAQNELALFGANRDSELLGYFRESLAVKAVEPAEGIQDGGATTALLKFMLREGFIEAALLTGRDEAWRPLPFVATTEAEIDSAAGSKYTSAPALSTLGPALERFQRLAFVGVPCQIAALRNLQQRKDPAYPAERVVVSIGLFCAESFTYGQAGTHGIAEFVEADLKMRLDDVTRFDIKKNNLMVFEGERIEARPLAEIKHLGWPICHSCPDFTAELADLSFGAVGSKSDENTVLVRSGLGQEILGKAVQAGVLESRPIQNLAIVERLAQNKLDRRAGLSPEALQFLTKRTIRGNYKKAGLG